MVIDNIITPAVKYRCFCLLKCKWYPPFTLELWLTQEVAEMIEFLGNVPKILAIGVSL